MQDRLPGFDSAEAIFMAEDIGLCTRVRHHKIKLVLFLSAMRHFRDRLAECGRVVRYHELDSGESSLLEKLALEQPTRIVTYDIADRFFREELQLWAEQHGIELTFVLNPMFLTPLSVWRAYRAKAKRLLMGDF